MTYGTKYPQLTDAQKQAVFHTNGPLLVIAGPGSGKTRVITYRIAALIDAGVRPFNICAITFTNKAADEMRQRAVALGASAGAHISTFHSLCVRILRRYADKAHIKPNFSIYNETEQASCMKQAIKDCELETSNFPPSKMLEAVSSLKNRLIDIDAFQRQAEGFYQTCLAKTYVRYQQILQQNNALDFDDLLLKAAFLLEGEPDVRQQLSERFRFLLIDEYQDTNHAQYRIARALVCQHNNICATGDPDQSIYRWRGADIRNILAFEKDWPDATIVRLQENFRSTPNILAAADRLISNNQSRKQKTLIPTRSAGPDVAVIACEDQTDEAERLAEEIKRLTDEGASPKEIALFYRINAQSRPLEEALIKNRIAYQIVRGVEFYNRKEIRDTLAYLKILVNPDDELSLLRIINTPSRGIGKTTLQRVLAFAAANNISAYAALGQAQNITALGNAPKVKIKAFIGMVEAFKKDINGPVAPLAQRVFAESGLEAALQAASQTDAIENVTELINAAALYDKNTEEPSLVDYLQQIALFSDADSYDASSDRVALMTLHTAKGLEFENVFVVGLEQGLLPHERSSEDEEELEEERRLFFVGITRTKQRLYITFARYRTFRGQLLRTIPSEFLFELGIDLDQQETVIDSARSQAAAGAELAGLLRPGQAVCHDTFGNGRVKQFIDMGSNSIAVVQFNSGHTRTLMLKYAGLSIL